MLKTDLSAELIQEFSSNITNVFYRGRITSRVKRNPALSKIYIKIFLEVGDDLIKIFRNLFVWINDIPGTRTAPIKVWYLLFECMISLPSNLELGDSWFKDSDVWINCAWHLKKVV